MRKETTLEKHSGGNIFSERMEIVGRPSRTIPTRRSASLWMMVSGRPPSGLGNDGGLVGGRVPGRRDPKSSSSRYAVRNA